MNNFEQKIKELESRIDILEKKINRQPSKIDVMSVNRAKISLNEFIKDKKPDDDVKRTLAIAYWLDKFESIEFFNTSDIENGFRSARLVVPANINDKVNMNIKNGFLTDNKEKKEGKKAWYVTNSGIEFVESGFIK